MFVQRKHVVNAITKTKLGCSTRESSNPEIGQCLRRHQVRRSLAVALGFGLLSVGLAGAQIAPETTTMTAPSSLRKQVGDQVSSSQVPVPEVTPPPNHDPIECSEGSNRRFINIVKRGARDQAEIYSAPFQRHELKWDAVFLAATGGLIAIDRPVTTAISHHDLSTSVHISDAGLYSTIAATGVVFISGIATKSDRAREAGFLGFEAVANTLAVEAVTQLAAGRERPLEGAGHGRFWINNALNSSFPSLHSGITWSMAAVMAHEYRRPWVQFLAYGTATTVSVTRVTGLKHFPADVAVGGAFGYLIGRHVFHVHSRFVHANHN